MKNAFQIFIKEAELIQDEYPGLKLDADDKNGARCISGIIQLKSDSGLFIDSYTIKITDQSNYKMK